MSKILKKILIFLKKYKIDKSYYLRVEKIYYDPIYKKFFFILTSLNRNNEIKIYISTQNNYCINLLHNIYYKNNIVNELFRNLKLKVKKLKILKFSNYSNSGECILKGVLFDKKLKLNIFDIIYLSVDNDIEIEIPKEIIKNKFITLIDENQNDDYLDNEFYSKFEDKNYYLDKNNEVIM